MGADDGFDLFPPLHNTSGDNHLCAEFLTAVHKRFKHDPVLHIDEKRNTLFQQGEHPTLTRDGCHFRRFSAKITGSYAQNVEYYLSEARNIAISFFETARVYFWNELFEVGLDTLPYSCSGVYADATQALASAGSKDFYFVCDGSCLGYTQSRL